jgi:hypothetical protein
MRALVAIIILTLSAINLYLAFKLASPELDRASDRICVPLYDQTGLECCQ